MITEDLRNLLAAGVEHANEYIPKGLDLIHNPERRTRIGGVLSSLSYRHIGLGMHGYFVDGNIQSLKQHLSLASMLAVASTRESGGQDMSGWSLLMYAMLSDNSVVIDTVSHLEPEELVKNRDNPRLPQFDVHMLQLTLRDEHDALRAKIERGAKGAGKRFRAEFREGEDFFSLLLARNQPALEAQLHREASRWQAMRKKGTMTGFPLLEDLFAPTAVLYAKLCWLKGIPVQIDHPFVPKDWLPVAPLPNYENPYDFLKPDWVPPRRGLVGKISRWFAR